MKRLTLALTLALGFPIGWGAAAVPSPATQPAAPTIMGLKLTDVGGNVHSLGDGRDSAGVVVVVLNTECPISNKLIPQLNRLAKTAADANIEFYGMLSDPTVTRADGIKYAKDFAMTFPVLFDASAILAGRLQPTVTPEAYAFTPRGTLCYRGRIDDSYASPTKERGTTSHHDLEDAIARLTKATSAMPAELVTTEPVGCVFESWKHPAAADVAQVTYTRDIAPLLNANCVTCHREGEVSPFVLTSYKDAAKRAEMLADVTHDKVMPPWKAVEGFGDFHDTRRLSEDQIALLAAWAKAGAPEGATADLPAAPQFGSKDGFPLGTPDLVVKMPKAYNIPAEGRDIVRYFVLPMDLKENAQVIGYEYRPGNRRVVHHMIGFLDANGAARELAKTKGDGTSYESAGPGFLPTGGLGGWAPGATARLLPDGVGHIVAKGSDLVLQIHYHPDGKAETDQGELALYFAKKPIEHVVISWPMTNRAINIKAGDAHYVRTATVTAPVDVTLTGIIPHMHNVGREMKVIATLPDGSTRPLVYVKDWDWNWQDQYQYSQPIHLPRGTRVDMTALYDNSADNPHNPNNPPKDIHRGEQTTDEMCLCFLQLYVDKPLRAK